MPKMHLAFCNATRRWGGVKTWTIEFASALRQRGHEIFLYAKDNNFLERSRSEGLAAHEVDFGPDYGPASIRRFCREFREKRIDAVLVNVGKDLRTAGVAARLCGLPLVQRIGLPGDMENSLKVRLTHSLLKPHYLCPCFFIRDGMLDNLPFVHKSGTSVIYSAKTPLPAPPGSLGSPLRILSCSQVNANKGHAELARTLHLLKREGFAFFWDVAGTGDRLEDLRRLCAALGLADRVRFHGFVQDTAALLRQADIFALSSYTEGLPNTLLEALAHGLVPVARDVGGVRECWPGALPFAPAPNCGEEKKRDWHAPGEYCAGQLPLYAPLRAILSAPPHDLLQWKQDAWEHCVQNFSLQQQVVKLEDFFRERISESGTQRRRPGR